MKTGQLVDAFPHLNILASLPADALGFKARNRVVLAISKAQPKVAEYEANRVKFASQHGVLVEKTDDADAHYKFETPEAAAAFDDAMKAMRDEESGVTFTTCTPDEIGDNTGLDNNSLNQLCFALADIFIKE